MTSSRMEQLTSSLLWHTALLSAERLDFWSVIPLPKLAFQILPLFGWAVLAVSFRREPPPQRYKQWLNLILGREDVIFCSHWLGVWLHTFLKGIVIHTIALLSIGEVRGDLHKTSLIDTHPHQSFVHAFNQLLLSNIHVVGAAPVIAETDGAWLNFSSWDGKSTFPHRHFPELMNFHCHIRTRAILGVNLTFHSLQIYSKASLVNSWLINWVLNLCIWRWQVTSSLWPASKVPMTEFIFDGEYSC